MFVEAVSLCAFAIPIAISDLKSLRVPDLLSLGGIACILSLQCFLDRSLPLASCAAGLVGFGSFWLIRAVTRGRLGMGDVKYSALVGVSAGLPGWFESVFVASLTALCVGLYLVVGRGFPADRRIPFAPFLTLGLAATLVMRRLGFAP